MVRAEQESVQIRTALLNILEDFSAEKEQLQRVHRAAINILKDFDSERQEYRLTQKAVLNILSDVEQERRNADTAQKALLNILEDAEAERQKALEAKALLETVNKELEAFSYSVSHDLQAPLRALSGFSQAVIEDYYDRVDENGRHYLGLIQKNAHKMGQLINDLLAFSRLGRQQIAKSTINITELFISTFEELKALTPERNIRFSVAELPFAYGDKAMVRQVLVNILSNAIKFTRPRKDAIIEAGSSIMNGEVVYFVKDNGVGFDMRFSDKLFGVFQRLHSEAEFEGTGVGLALVYRIITRHKGRIWAESETGKGAVFYFTFAPKQEGE